MLYISHDVAKVLCAMIYHHMPPLTSFVPQAFVDACDPAPDPAREPLVSWPWTLALRKWSQLVPSMEFRCFVTEGVLVGVCQVSVMPMVVMLRRLW